MNRVLYSGKVMDDTELRRVNCILQTQANNMWSEVRTYDFLYKSSYRNYLNGYIEYSNSSSEYNSATSEIGNMNLIVNTTVDIEGVQEAQQAAQQTADDSVSDREETEDENTVEIIEGLPDDWSFNGLDYYDTDSPYDQDVLDQFKAMDQEEKEANVTLADAVQALQDSIDNDRENKLDTFTAQSYVNNPEASAGESQTYVNNETGQTQTVSISDDGQTITVSGVTASDGTVGTVTQNPNGTMTFTTEDGTSMPWTGGTPQDIVNNAYDYNEKNASQETYDAAAAAKEAQEHLHDLQKENTEIFNEYAQDVAERMSEETPSGNPGYSESDSSSWSDPSYDPSEWEGF